MHPALFLEEILQVIFRHCFPKYYVRSPEQRRSASDLIALASTCQVFKEPALDVLWMELDDITPLARCLPDICFLKGSEFGRPTYSFKRQLNESERETVKMHTRRVRSLATMNPSSISPESLEDLCLPSMADPLFPNIRHLRFYIADQTLPLIHHLSGPNLTQIYIHFAVFDISCRSFVQSLGRCPNLTSINISLDQTLVGLDETMNRHICHWKHLQMMDCRRLNLDSNALLHLSHIPGLTKLSFTLSHELTKQITSLNHLIVFSSLRSLQLSIASNVPVSKLLTNVRLPVVSNIYTSWDDASPSRHSIKSFSLALQQACQCTHSVTKFLSIVHHASILTDENSAQSTLTLGLDDIHPFTVLNLTGIQINFDCSIDLKDCDLLDIASACPQLISLVINEYHGWRTPGITPAGMLQFLQRCLDLRRLCITLDARGFTSLPLPQIQTGGGNPMALPGDVNIGDSPIDAESVPALATLFAGIFPQLARGRFYFRSWGSFVVRDRSPDWEVYTKRWEDVHALAKKKLLEQSPGSVEGAVETKK